MDTAVRLYRAFGIEVFVEHWTHLRTGRMPTAEPLARVREFLAAGLGQAGVAVEQGVAVDTLRRAVLGRVARQA